MSAPVELLVGLGNPGPRYAHTRHNVGKDWVESVAAQLGACFSLQKNLHSELAKVSIGQHSVWLAMPTRYMNESGQSVGAIARYYKIPPKAILVVHDELDLPAGTLRLKTNGGLGGHNGLVDIERHLGTKQFNRLRIGIGRPASGASVSEYVLSKASRDQAILTAQACDLAHSHLAELIQPTSWPLLMNALHTDPPNHTSHLKET